MIALLSLTMVVDCGRLKNSAASNEQESITPLFAAKVISALIDGMFFASPLSALSILALTVLHTTNE